MPVSSARSSEKSSSSAKRAFRYPATAVRRHAALTRSSQRLPTSATCALPSAIPHLCRAAHFLLAAAEQSWSGDISSKTSPLFSPSGVLLQRLEHGGGAVNKSSFPRESVKTRQPSPESRPAARPSSPGAGRHRRGTALPSGAAPAVGSAREGRKSQPTLQNCCFEGKAAQSTAAQQHPARPQGPHARPGPRGAVRAPRPRTAAGRPRQATPRSRGRDPSRRRTAPVGPRARRGSAAAPAAPRPRASPRSVRPGIPAGRGEVSRRQAGAAGPAAPHSPASSPPPSPCRGSAVPRRAGPLTLPPLSAEDAAHPSGGDRCSRAARSLQRAEGRGEGGGRTRGPLLLLLPSPQRGDGGGLLPACLLPPALPALLRSARTASPRQGLTAAAAPLAGPGARGAGRRGARSRRRTGVGGVRASTRRT